MEIRLLKKGYKGNDDFYNDFIEGKLLDKEEYFTEDVVTITNPKSFPIYMGKANEEEKAALFMEAFEVITECYLNTDRDIHFDEVFWHSLLCCYKQDYLIENYPEILEGISNFNNIVLKKFDWENYIYKSVLAAQYINDNIKVREEKQKYFNLIIENLDLFNYIIKYEIFRNDKFLINILTIVDELDLSKVLKSKIKDRPDLGKDERIGRRVIFEFNKSYPIILAPMLDKEELKEIFLEYLSYYYKIESDPIDTLAGIIND